MSRLSITLSPSNMNWLNSLVSEGEFTTKSAAINATLQFAQGFRKARPGTELAPTSPRHPGDKDIDAQ